MAEEHIHERTHASTAAALASFRFEAFADASSAQAAFESRYPPGSRIEPALQALADMEAHCRALGPTRVVCRYVEKPATLACWCWHVALDCSTEKVIQRVKVALAIIAS